MDTYRSCRVFPCIHLRYADKYHSFYHNRHTFAFFHPFRNWNFHPKVTRLRMNSGYALNSTPRAKRRAKRQYHVCHQNIPHRSKHLVELRLYLGHMRRRLCPSYKLLNRAPQIRSCHTRYIVSLRNLYHTNA